jgi:hypothetical protein
MSRITVRCECGRMIAETAMGIHKSKCLGAAAMPVGHNLCACSNLKPERARTCWACEDKSPEFEELNRLIADGVDIPRILLEDER